MRWGDQATKSAAQKYAAGRVQIAESLGGRLHVARKIGKRAKRCFGSELGADNSEKGPLGA